MKNKGFSMVELIIVIAIMAILTGVLAPMLVHYIAKARLRRLYFGAYDTKGGFAVSNSALLSHPGLMHKTECYCGIMEEECSALLNSFFSRLRSDKTY